MAAQEEEDERQQPASPAGDEECEPVQRGVDIYVQDGIPPGGMFGGTPPS